MSPSPNIPSIVARCGRKLNHPEPAMHRLWILDASTESGEKRNPRLPSATSRSRNGKPSVLVRVMRIIFQSTVASCLPYLVCSKDVVVGGSLTRNPPSMGGWGLRGGGNIGGSVDSRGIGLGPPRNGSCVEALSRQSRYSRFGPAICLVSESELGVP